MPFRKPQLIPLLFTITAVGVCLMLGFWQVERLQWKNAMLASIAQAQTQPPLSALPADAQSTIYRNVALQGEYLQGRLYRLVGRMQGDTPGFFILNPLRMADGRVVLVNRGYAPKDKEIMPSDPETVVGIVRPLREKRYFSPPNDPVKNVWFYEDISALSEASGAPLLPVVVEAIGEPRVGVYPIPNDGKISLRNDHLGYAVTWFMMAVVALIMALFYHRVPKP